MSIHDDHRKRLRERFLEEGLDTFTEVQVLELLLFYCLPRVDTNPIAHALLDQFGSLAQVMETPPEELKRVDGVGEATAIFLALIHAFDRQYQKSKVKDNKILPTIDDCGEYLMSRFKNQRNETVYLLCLDAKCKVLCCKKIGEGSINSASVPIRRVVEIALGNNAVSVVLAHNHPGGLAIPSAEDLLTTRRIAQALDAVEIRLADHIIVAEDDYISLAQSGLYNPDSSVTLV